MLKSLFKHVYCILFVLFLSASAFGATYQNTTSNPITVQSPYTQGGIVVFLAGQTQSVDFIIDTTKYPGLVETSSSPYYNPTTAVANVTSTGPGNDQTVAILTGTNSLEIVNLSSATATVYLESESNTPGLVIPAGGVRSFDEIGQGRVDQIMIQFSGELVTGVMFNVT